MWLPVAVVGFREGCFTDTVLPTLCASLLGREPVPGSAASVEASLQVLPQDPLLLLHEGLIGGRLAHVPLPLLLLLEGLNPALLC